MKNILLFIVRFPGYGGIESVTEIIGNSLLQEGSKISIITPLAQERKSDLMGCVRYYKLPNEKKFDAPENRTITDNVMHDNHFDAVIFQDSYADWHQMICEMCDKYHLSLYVFEHNTPLYTICSERHDPWYMPKEVYRKLYWHRHMRQVARERKLYLLEHCTKYVLLSKYFIPEFCDFIGINRSEKITYINNPILYSPIDVNSLTKKNNIILTVCRISSQKRVNSMIDMWKTISGQLSDWKFVIVGDGEDKAGLMDRVSSESIPNVQFVDFADPTPYYEHAKIFWMTSVYEGWPMTLFEAMQKGCVPVVYQSFSSVQDMIDNKENGYLVNNNDISEFESSTITLARNPSILKKMADSAIKKVEQFDVKQIIEDWKRLLE